jgi:nitrous oxidase accessory protein NosD
MKERKWIAILFIASLLSSFGALNSQSLAKSSSLGATNQSHSVAPPAGALIVPDNYPTIQAAIANASAGETVFVKEGTYYYYGGPVADAIIIDKSLSLIGQNSQKTVLQEASSDYSTVGNHYLTQSAVKIMANNVTISGFTVDEAWYSEPYQISINGPTYYQNISGVNFGIMVGDEPNYYSGCKIIGNNIINCLEGVSVSGGENNIVSANKIGNTIGKGSGVGISMQSSNSVISNNDITGMGDTGIIVSSCANVTIKENNIAGSSSGLDNGTVNYIGALLLSNNGSYVYDNNITDNSGFGIEFQQSTNATVFNNSILRNGLGIYLPNFQFYPNTSVGGLGNKVYCNNIINNTQKALVEHALAYNISDGFVNGTDTVLWDNGTLGNYWSDYQSKYRNATEVDASGIGNTPCIIDENNTDHYPLMQQVDISVPAPTPTPAAPGTGIPSLTIALIVVVVVFVVFVVSLLFYRTHRKERLPECL